MQVSGRHPIPVIYRQTGCRWSRAMSDRVLGRLDDAAAHLAVAQAHAETTPPDRRRRLRMSIAAVQLSLARRRGHLSGVLEQVAFLASPLGGETDEDIALGSDLRALALLNLGTAEAWAPTGLADAERHLQEGAALAREIGRPYLEVGCLAQLGFASRIRSFAIAQQRCRQAIALAERYGGRPARAAAGAQRHRPGHRLRHRRRGVPAGRARPPSRSARAS